MSDENHRLPPDILERATGALRDAPVPGGPPPELAAATVAAVESRLPVVRLADERRKRMMRYVRYSTGLAAAVAVATVAGVLWTPRESAAAEFKRAMANAGKVKAMTARFTQKIGAQPRPPVKLSVRGNQGRLDIPPPPDAPANAPAIVAAFVFDTDRGRAASINYGDKTIEYVTATDAGPSPYADLIDQFRKLARKDAELIDEEKVNGRPTRVFRVKKGEFAGRRLEADDELRVWIDDKTEIPVKVQLDVRSHKAEQTYVFDEFVWDPKLDDALFSLDVPEGFTVKAAQPEKK